MDRILLKTFASENLNKGKLVDLGCGPGQTTKYLSECGLTDLLGVDISIEMITIAKKVNPHLNFETATSYSIRDDGEVEARLTSYVENKVLCNRGCPVFLHPVFQFKKIGRSIDKTSKTIKSNKIKRSLSRLFMLGVCEYRSIF